MQDNRMGFGQRILITLLTLVLVSAFFYGLDHMVMSMQGLPLNVDLTPAN